MKSHDLANILELASKLLRSLPNNDIAHNISHLQTLVNNSAKQEIQKYRKHSITLPENINQKLRTMSTQELEEYLNDNSLFVSTASIQKLSEVMGLQTSTRQSRSALINLIVRHHEATQMDSIIRNSSKTEKEDK